MFGIYIHWPFCLSLCPYCDFNSYVANDIDHDAFLKAYILQLQYLALNAIDKNVTSIYFGGGTPSLMKPYVVDAILQTIDQLFIVDKNCEITLEANPTSFEIDKFKEFKTAGINRVSIGVQSFDDKELKFLGRQHSGEEAKHAITQAKALFSNVTFDLIYALPSQTLNEWKNRLQYALNFDIPHLSLYTLVIEPGTVFEKFVKLGRFKPQSSDQMSEFYDYTNNIMIQNNFKRYEISNYAKEGFESRHNLTYWKLHDYIGIGPGAHGRYFLNNSSRYQTECFAKPKTWLEKCQTKTAGFLVNSIIDKHEQIMEALLLGLRIENGINLISFKDRFGFNILDFLNKDKMNNFVNLNLLQHDEHNLKLTDAGRNVLNYIINNLI